MSDSKNQKAVKRVGLGRGFGSLIPDKLEAAILVEEGERVRQLKRSDIAVNPTQPRTHFDEAALRQLASSIKKHGIIQPIVVTPVGSNTYQIVAGERRWRAAAMAGLDRVPALVRTLKELEKHELALIENVQRVDLNPLEQAKSIEYLHQQFNVSYQQIAKKIGKAEATVSNIVRLLQLPVPAQTALAEGGISEGHARQILALKNDPAAQHVLLQRMTDEGWSVRRAEQYVQSVKQALKEGSNNKPAKPKKSTVLISAAQLNYLKEQYHAEVKVRETARGNRVEFVFKNQEHLEKLLDKLQQDA